MNKIYIPGFSAEATLYKNTKPYRVPRNSDSANCGTSIDPQLIDRPSGPDGPIGLPGQNCSNACDHICKLNGMGMGPFYSQCMTRCMRGCHQPLPHGSFARLTR